MHFAVLQGAGAGVIQTANGEPSPGISLYFSLQAEKATGKGFFLDTCGVGLFDVGQGIVALGLQKTLRKRKVFSGLGYGVGLLGRDDFNKSTQHEPGGYVKAFAGIQAGSLLFHITALGILGTHDPAGGVVVGAGIRF